MALFQTDNLWLSQLENGVAALYLDVKERPVNVLSQQVLGDIEQALDRIEHEGSFRLLLIRSGKKGNFIAGADISEFPHITSPEMAMTFTERGQKLYARLEAMSIPSIAVINGACLGGGMELALACDYRIVVNDPRVQLGLPEIELGLLPAWGGSQRLPRIVGLERALQMILSAGRVRCREAVEIGLADGMIDNPDQALPVYTETPSKRPKTNLPLKSWRQRLVEGNPLGRWFLFTVTRRYLQQRVPDDMPAPWEALEAIRIGVHDGIEAGLKYEREAAGRLAVSPACRHLVQVFFQRENARKLPEKTGEEKPIQRVAVVGAGTMGTSIAQLVALRGCEVVVRDEDKNALGMGMLRIVALFEQAIKRGIIAPEESARRLNAVFADKFEWDRFDKVDLVIEAIIEDLKIKKKVFKEIEEHVGPDAIIATNTSSLRVQHLQEGLKHPGRVAGLHFFNPVHKMPLVEVVRSPATKQKVITDLLHFVVALGKTPVVVKDSPGFLVNRILMPYLNEALLLVSEGWHIEQVDRAMIRFGMPMGPLELLDNIGLDVAAHIAQSIGPSFGERMAPHPGFELLSNKGWKGKKTDTGFYRWRGKRKKPNHLAENTLREQAKEMGIKPVTIASVDEAVNTARERMLGLMLNEAVACLAEGIVENAETLNLAMILGTGWAPHRGGPLKYAEERGYGEIVASLQQLEETYGKRFQPCAELKHIVLGT